MNFGEVQYGNIFADEGAVLSYNGSATWPNDGNPINAFDWFDWTVARVTSGAANTWVKVVLPEDTTLDRLTVYLAPLASAKAINLQVETGVGTDVWTTVATINFVASSANQCRGAAFVEVPVNAGVGVRVIWPTARATPGFRQLYAGGHTTFEIGQYQGIAPPKLTQDVIVTNSIAVNGSILGRDVRRVTRSNTIDLSPLSPGWVRDTWEPFVAHATRQAFFWSWAPELYPDDITFAAAESINAPTNTSPSPKMAVQMPLRTVI